MSIKNRKVSEGEVSQTIDLDKYLGKASKVDSIKETFIQAVIDTIVNRTESSRDIDGKIFGKYSKGYEHSLAFKVFGKSDKPNLVLTGDMLGSIDTINSSSKAVTIGVTGENNIVKAFAHITGFEGHPTIKNGKKRDFFGVTDAEIEKISNQLKPDLNRKESASSTKINNKILQILNSANGKDESGDNGS